MDIVTNQAIVQKRITVIHEIVCIEQEKVSFLEVQGTEVNIELGSLRKQLEFNKLKTNGLETQTCRIEKETAQKSKVEIQEDIFKS